ncbi:hypothetical protein GM415_08075 [Pseudodesulfovibrio cashew]|uniref:Uncharacterized protein n=1 Tax=Pseudodesulfovibrio cashew TaxID=2678688 RepID=A0A6I6JBE7_9BACT|nr:hypothetical protein [Pseudodesulfovibrio cashew]QGY40085.1 hypothetical protein GM415_08075 [Pseudodesulfovibrio cashew]
MKTSESDAKFKFCPLLKTSDDKMKMCQGSMCMMWRWVPDEKGGDTEEGYCGLAGTPCASLS